MDIKLQCACGSIQGTAVNITPENGNRVVCCCCDCQAFAVHLDQDEKTLDQFGGTEIFQTSQSQVRISKGSSHLRSIKLTPKGLTRWYAGCCNTPIANTVKSDFPFVGLIHNFMQIKGDRDNVLGEVRAYVQTQYARGNPTHPRQAKKFPIGIILRIMRKILHWKLKGMHKPSVFFLDDGNPVSRPSIVRSEAASGS